MSATRVAPSSLPGFDESLKLLVEREQYSLTDIGLMFGVTREGARMWCVVRGIKYPEGTVRGLAAVRVWDDAANRFHPVGRGVVSRARKSVARAVRHGAANQRRAKRQSEVVEAVVRLRASLFREPTWREMARALGFTGDDSRACIYVLNCFDSQRRRSSEKHAKFVAAVERVPRPSGGAGHVGPRKRTATCRRGHERTPENTRDDSKGHSYCAPCRRLTDSARYAAKKLKAKNRRSA